MTDRPITRIVSAEQALRICRAPFVCPDQRTLLDAPAPVPDRGPGAAPTLAPNQPTLIRVHSALGHPVREARILPPNQPTFVNGVPAAIVDDIPTVRVVSQPTAPQPAALLAVSLPPPPAMVCRGHAVAFVVLVALGAALLTGGIVAALYERPRPAPTTPAQPPSEPDRDAVLHPRR
jgi:hypothetical protein